jgi:uncharacterized protein (TIGR02453 family)
MAPYFKRDLFDFLKELSVHNNRGWFQANKERYEKQVRDPFLRLIADLGPGLKKINPNFVVDPRPNGGSMMRIHRDIRFSKDKSPYKTFVAAHFPHKSGKGGDTPAYYLRLDPFASIIGAGVWQPEPAALKKIRNRIVREPDIWQTVTTCGRPGLQCSIGGQSLKRAPKGFDSDHPLIEDVKRKNFGLSFPLKQRDILGTDLLDQVLERFSLAAPFVAFLSRAIGLH